MKVTEVRISPAKGGKVRAFASIVIDDCFIVNDLRVVEGREGQLFVTMPARKARSGQMRDVAYPLNAETREQVDQRVLEEYDEAVRNHVVPERSRHSSARRSENRSVVDRVAARLFSEDFWTAEVPRSQEGEE